MRRNTLILLASFCIVITLTGCSLFGKKPQQAAADPYDPGFDTTAEFENYPVYRPLPEATESDSYSGATTTLAATAGTGRTHTVAKKETLYSIARTYYNGDQARWKEIYEANRSAIGDPNMIRVGQKLTIP
jgi:nucleoid-associated protein YgaU